MKRLSEFLNEALNEGVGVRLKSDFEFDKEHLLKICKKNAVDVMNDIGSTSGLYVIHFKKGSVELFWFVYVDVRNYFSRGCAWNPDTKKYSGADPEVTSRIFSCSKYHNISIDDADFGCKLTVTDFKAYMPWSLEDYLDKNHYPKEWEN